MEESRPDVFDTARMTLPEQGNDTLRHLASGAEHAIVSSPGLEERWVE